LSLIRTESRLLFIKSRPFDASSDKKQAMKKTLSNAS